MKKQKRRTNPIARALRQNPVFKPRYIKDKRGITKHKGKEAKDE